MANQEIGTKTTPQRGESKKSMAYLRFTLAQRMEHILLIASFTLLALTGLPQKFVGSPFAEWMIAVFGGIETIRNIHHVAAMVFLLEGVYHFVVVAYKIFVRRVSMSMLPGAKDAVDAIDMLRFNLGLSHEHPRMPRYNFAEKAEYWAMLWGGVVMGITGFMLWNPIFTAKLLPGQVIPAAKAAHGGEAILAVLAIIVWHVYNVHLKSFNKSMFTGKLSRHEMEEEHGEEWETLESGASRPPADPAGVRSRERVFVPIIFASATLLVAGLFWFATFESTAIDTLPATQAPAFVPLTPTPVPASTGVRIGAPIPHPVEGQEECNGCHGENGIRPFPSDHAGRTDESCLVCHQPGTAEGGTVAAAAAIPHAVEGRETCSQCHGGTTSLLPLPASHSGRSDDMCTACHKPAVGELDATATSRAIPHSITDAAHEDCRACHGEGKAQAMPASHAVFQTTGCTACHEAAIAAEPTASETSGTSAPGAIPHGITDAAYQDCTVCHGIGKTKPFPENHSTYSIDSCLTCHRPAATSEAVETPSSASAVAIPHVVDVAGFSDCTTCHGAGEINPFPDNHAAFDTAMCTTCHQAPDVALASATPIPSAAPGIPHSITAESFTKCMTCHGAGDPAPAPDDHAEYSTASCPACHKAELG